MLKLKKTLGILLALCFILSVTAAAASAHGDDGPAPPPHDGPDYNPLPPYPDGPDYNPLPPCPDGLDDNPVPPL